MDIYHAMAGKGLDRAVVALVVELKSKLNIGKSSVLNELILITENLFRFFFFLFFFFFERVVTLTADTVCYSMY